MTTKEAVKILLNTETDDLFEEQINNYFIENLPARIKKYGGDSGKITQEWKKVRRQSQVAPYIARKKRRSRTHHVPKKSIFYTNRDMDNSVNHSFSINEEEGEDDWELEPENKIQPEFVNSVSIMD